jgi:hypothetical protein
VVGEREVSSMQIFGGFFCQDFFVRFLSHNFRLTSDVDNDTQPMESLSETKWDVVIAGTGLAQSLLALSVL